MALSAGNKVVWSDIQTIYNNLNTARQHCSIATVTVPSNPGKTVPSTVQSLKDAIEACRSNSYVSRAGTWSTGVTVPSRGSLLYSDIFTRMSTTVENIRRTCMHNSANFSGNNGFRSFGNHGFDSNSNNTFHSGSSGTSNSFST